MSTIDRLEIGSLGQEHGRNDQNNSRTDDAQDTNRRYDSRLDHRSKPVVDLPDSTVRGSRGA